MPYSTLIIETPRDTHLKHARIERVLRNREIFAVSEQAPVDMLIFQEYPHSLPLAHQEKIQIGVIPHLDFPLIEELRERRIVAGRIVARIEMAIDTELHPEHVAHRPKLVIIREEGADERNGYDTMIRTPLQQNLMVQMKSGDPEIFAGVHARHADASVVLRYLAVGAVINLIGDNALPHTDLERIIGDTESNFETSFILLAQGVNHT